MTNILLLVIFIFSSSNKLIDELLKEHAHYNLIKNTRVLIHKKPVYKKLSTSAFQNGETFGNTKILRFLNKKFCL